MKAQLANDFLLQKGYPYFDIVYENADGIIKASYSMLDSRKDQMEAFQKTVEIYSPTKLWIMPRQKNGNNYSRFAQKEVIDLDSISPKVVPLNGVPAHQPAQMEVYRAEPDSFGMNPTSMSGALSSAMAEVWKFKYHDEQSRRQELSHENKSLKEELERLKKENFELEKENRYKDKDFELKAKMEESERKSGLNGLVETGKELMASPESLAGLASVIEQVNNFRRGTRPQLLAGMPEGVEPAWLQDARAVKLLSIFANQSEDNKEILSKVMAKAITNKLAAVQFIQ